MYLGHEENKTDASQSVREFNLSISCTLILRVSLIFHTTSFKKKKVFLFVFVGFFFPLVAFINSH